MLILVYNCFQSSPVYCQVYSIKSADPWGGGLGKLNKTATALVSVMHSFDQMLITLYVINIIPELFLFQPFSYLFQTLNLGFPQFFPSAAFKLQIYLPRLRFPSYDFYFVVLTLVDFIFVASSITSLNYGNYFILELKFSKSC